MREPTAAQAAKRLLHDAALQLGTTSPARVRPISDVLDASLSYPVGDREARTHRALETNFSEIASDSLALDIEPGGPRVSALDRLDLATHAMGDIVSQHFGPEARYWLDGRAEPVSGGRRHMKWGASFGSSLDRDGIREAHVCYEWGPDLSDALPPALGRLARTAMEFLPGARPFLSTIRCGRSSGTQQVTFSIDRALPLSGLQPLMDELGLGDQHSSLMTTAAFLMGARFVLPPDTATLTLRPSRFGVEMRLDINLDALPDPPERLLPLLKMQMTERPESTRSLDRWLMALTPDGFPGPGSVTVLSIIVRPNLPARVALYLRPYVLDGAPEHSDAQPNTSTVAPNGKNGATAARA